MSQRTEDELNEDAWRELSTARRALGSWLHTLDCTDKHPNAVLCRQIDSLFSERDKAKNAKKKQTEKSNSPQHDLETCCCVDCCAIRKALAGAWVINDP